jgi:hypothetical protein
VVAASVYEWYSVLGWYAVVRIGGAFLVGGVVGFGLGRGWWSMFFLYAVGFVILLAVLPSSGFEYSSASTGAETAAWFQWILGVSAGAGVRVLLRRQGLRLGLVRRF